MTVNPYYTIQCNSAVRHRRTGIPLMSGGDPLVFTAHPADEIGKALLGHVAFQAEAVPVICGCSSKEKGVQCYNTLIKYICDTYICLAHPHNQTYTSGCVSQDFSAPHKLFKIIKGVYKT